MTAQTATAQAPQNAPDFRTMANAIRFLAADAVDQGVASDPEGLAHARAAIKLRVKAGIARNIWGDAGYYRVLLGDDAIYNAARKALDSPQGILAP